MVAQPRSEARRRSGLSRRPYTVGIYDAPGELLDPSPKVIFWYRVYAGLMLFAALVVFALVLVYAWLQTLPEQAMRPGSGDRQTIALLLVLVAAAQAAFHAVGAFVPRKPWGWTYGLMVIAVGLPGLLAIPLLVFWLKPEAKAAFCRL